MSVEGVHAWIAEVERKLGKRTRVFLALTVIAIGIAGASLYLAIDYRSSSVSEADVRALQEELEARIDAGGGTATAPTAPPAEEAQPAPQATPTPPAGGQGSQQQGGKGSGGGGDSGASGGGGSGTSGGGASAGPGSASGGAADSAKLQELIEQAKKRAEENE
jgi:uncharacterized membrane protein YgcG